MFKISLRSDPKLKKLLDKIDNPQTIQKALSAMAIELKNSTRARFFFSKDPLGRTWKKSEAAKREGRRTLVKTGRLRDSVDTNVKPKRIELGIPKATNYGKYFQLGSKPQVKREFLGISKSDRKIMTKILKRELSV